MELAEINTAANTLAPRTTSALNFEIIKNNVDEIVLVRDEEMVAAARWLWSEVGIASELSGAAALAALLARKFKISSRKICALVCGAGNAGIGY